MKKWIIEKRYLIFIILLFVFLTFLEIGIIHEVLWHGFGGYGDVSMVLPQWDLLEVFS